MNGDTSMRWQKSAPRLRSGAKQPPFGDELLNVRGIEDDIPALIFRRTGLELVFLEPADDEHRAGRAVIYSAIDIDTHIAFFYK